jgi:HEAT repeat protein
VSEYGAAATGAFAAAAVDSANFRTRYLLVSPAAELAATDAPASDFLRRALTTEERPEIRAQAARSVRAGNAFVNELSAATTDEAVRVREAAVLALGSARADAARDRLVQRLKDDDWPLVRAASARALSGLSPSQPGDGALTDALSDASADVRRAALASLGTHQVTASASRVEDRLNDDEELPSVRATAAVVLGAICDGAAADVLTEHARRLVDPGADDSARMIARSALSGLAVLKPPDLASRLAPLRGPKAPAVVRKAAEEALAAPGHCGPKKTEAPRARAK